MKARHWQDPRAWMAPGTMAGATNAAYDKHKPADAPRLSSQEVDEGLENLNVMLAEGKLGPKKVRHTLLSHVTLLTE